MTISNIAEHDATGKTGFKKWETIPLPIIDFDFNVEITNYVSSLSKAFFLC